MKIYRIDGFTSQSGHTGYTFFTNKKEAVKELLRRQAQESFIMEVDEIEIPISKKGILFLLRAWASHPDNG